MRFLSTFIQKPQILATRRTYTLDGKLTGHCGPVLCLSATDDGQLLASGGTDGVKIWNLVTKRRIPSPEGAGSRGATTAILFISRSDDPDEAIIYGTQTGKLAFEESYTFSLAGASEITTLAFDAVAGHLGAGNRSGNIYLFSLDVDMNLKIRFSVMLQGVTPKSLAFSNKGDKKEPQLLLFSLYDGTLYTLNTTDGNVENTKVLVNQIGNAAVDVAKNVFCIDDPGQGIALYRFDGTRLKNFPVKEEKPRPRPRQVNFAEGFKLIVCGSDHGVVYVFDRRKEEVVDELHTGNHNWIQTILTAQTDGQHFILAAPSHDTDKNTDILVWRKRDSRTIGMQMQRKYLQYFIQIMMLGATLAFLIQNGAQMLGSQPSSMVTDLPITRSMKQTPQRVLATERTRIPRKAELVLP
ncbi:WD40-repeat-containing domain protein [Rhodocollybia butyracea]|uniref:WD40-repeat-containing domain protein n=1 Tax=Rhodocollybia butyracea TaxID=206335 RepID=A0A9P5U145_9AGAR|nr:WD40-repeat-containing domain protein [Rhodocollybia butyracea]